MTAKKLPAVGTHVAVYEVDGVDWPGKKEGKPLVGVVTGWGAPEADPAWREFFVLPFGPDPSTNRFGETAAEYAPEQGWTVYNMNKWRRQTFIINELELT